MSAYGGKAEVSRILLDSPLLTLNGHSSDALCFKRALLEAAECAGDDVGAQHQQRDEEYPPEQLL